MVRVPVLSTTSVVSRLAVCRASPLRTSTPCSAALPTPIMVEIGVARPRAQGQAMISTVVAVTSMWMTRGSAPKLNHAKAVSTAMIITAGTKMLDTLSANSPMGDASSAPGPPAR